MTGGGHVVHPSPLLRAGSAAAQLAVAEQETGVADQDPGGVTLVAGARPPGYTRPVTVLQPAVVPRPGRVWTRVNVGGGESVPAREPRVAALRTLGVVAGVAAQQTVPGPRELVALRPQPRPRHRVLAAGVLQSAVDAPLLAAVAVATRLPQTSLGHVAAAVYDGGVRGQYL